MNRAFLFTILSLCVLLLAILQFKNSEPSLSDYENIPIIDESNVLYVMPVSYGLFDTSDFTPTYDPTSYSGVLIPATKASAVFELDRLLPTSVKVSLIIPFYRQHYSFYGASDNTYSALRYWIIYYWLSDNSSPLLDYYVIYVGISDKHQIANDIIVSYYLHLIASDGAEKTE